MKLGLVKIAAAMVGICVGVAASAEINIPTGNWAGNGVLIAAQTESLPYKLLVNVKKVANEYTWTQTFNFANGQTVTNVFNATLNPATGFINIHEVNGVAQASAGFCFSNEPGPAKMKCTFHWQQNGSAQEDTISYHGKNLAQFGSDEAIDQVWHDLSVQQ